MPAALTGEWFPLSGLHHRLILTRGLGGSLLRIASFSEWNYFFLISNLRHGSFLQSSGFIDQAADSGSGNSVLLSHFSQGQPGETVSHDGGPVNV